MGKPQNATIFHNKLAVFRVFVAERGGEEGGRREGGRKGGKNLFFVQVCFVFSIKMSVGLCAKSKPPNPCISKPPHPCILQGFQ